MKLYAVRYGKKFIYGTQGTIFRGVSDGNEPVKDFPFFYYLFEMDGKYTLVDTGFRDAALAAEMKVDLIPVKEELEKSVLLGQKRRTSLPWTRGRRL